MSINGQQSEQPRRTRTQTNTNAESCGDSALGFGELYTVHVHTFCDCACLLAHRTSVGYTYSDLASHYFKLNHIRFSEAANLFTASATLNVHFKDAQQLWQQSASATATNLSDLTLRPQRRRRTFTSLLKANTAAAHIAQTEQTATVCSHT